MGKRKSGMKDGTMLSDSPIVFGEVYRDDISGFTGKAIGIIRWITGCDQVALSSEAYETDGGERKDSQTKWFDDGRLVRVLTGVTQPSSGKGAAGVPPSGRVTG